MKITRRQLRRIIREVIEGPDGVWYDDYGNPLQPDDLQRLEDENAYEPTNVDKVYEIIQPLLDASNMGLDRQGEITMKIAELYDAAVDNPDEIYGHAEELLKKEAGYYDEDEEDGRRYAAGRPWEHN